MEFTDKDLTCVECGTSFVFSGAEQERHNQLGFTNEPKRCAPCRAAKKAARGGAGGGAGGGGGYENQSNAPAASSSSSAPAA